MSFLAKGTWKPHFVLKSVLAIISSESDQAIIFSESDQAESDQGVGSMAQW